MLIIKATRDAILRPLQTVAGIVERRHTLPILSNVLIRKTGAELSFVATDIEIQIATAASLSSSSEEVAITVNARKLIDILRALPETEVSISLAARKLTVSAGKTRFALQTLGPEDFPTITPAAEYQAAITLPQSQLKQLFAMVHFAMAQQDIRYYLNGLLMVVDGGVLRVVATDGHRLACCTADLPAEHGRIEVIVPRKTITELQRLLADSDAPVSFDIAANQIRFRFAEVDLLSKLVDGKFPDYQRVIPKGYVKSLDIERTRLAESLKRASILTSDKSRGVNFSLLKDVLRVQTRNAEQEEATEELDVSYEGEALDIGFNVSYLLDVLDNLKTEQVRIELGDSNSSALISVPGDEAFKYVVMPMRI